MYCDRQGDEVFVYGQEEFADWMSRQQRLDRACQETKWPTKEINSRKTLNVSSLSQSQIRLPQATASSACRDEMDWQAKAAALGVSKETISRVAASGTNLNTIQNCRCSYEKMKKEIRALERRKMPFLFLSRII